MNDGKSHSLQNTRTQGKRQAEEEPPVPRLLGLQEAVPSAHPFYPWRAGDAAGIGCVSVSSTTWCTAAVQEVHSIPSPPPPASVPLPLLQHAFMSLHRLTVTHLYPTAFLYSRGFFVVNLWLDYIPL